MPPKNQAIDSNARWQYNHRTFRPEAVEAYATRQAGEPWCAGLRGEPWLIAALSIAVAAAMTLVYWGGH